jgi:hypothetical protein
MKSNVIKFPLRGAFCDKKKLEDEMETARTTQELNDLAEGKDLIYEALMIPDDILELIKLKPKPKSEKCRQSQPTHSTQRSSPFSSSSFCG